LGGGALLTFFTAAGAAAGLLFVPFFAMETIGSCARSGLRLANGGREAENKP
jgi:hypothetical protein